MEVQDGFVQLMDVRRVKIAMEAISDTFTPVIDENFVNNMGEESSEVENEIIVREAYSDLKFGSNYSNDA
jgi:hypothetical protein